MLCSAECLSSTRPSASCNLCFCARSTSRPQRPRVAASLRPARPQRAAKQGALQTSCPARRPARPRHESEACHAAAPHAPGTKTAVRPRRHRRRRPRTRWTSPLSHRSLLLRIWTLGCLFHGNVGIHRAGHVGCHGKVSQALPYPEPLRVTGGKQRDQNGTDLRSHPYNAGRARLGGGWGGVCETLQNTS